MSGMAPGKGNCFRKGMDENGLMLRGLDTASACRRPAPGKTC